jgi:hypothetical protein
MEFREELFLSPSKGPNELSGVRFTEKLSGLYWVILNRNLVVNYHYFTLKFIKEKSRNIRHGNSDTTNEPITLVR